MLPPSSSTAVHWGIKGEISLHHTGPCGKGDTRLSLQLWGSFRAGVVQKITLISQAADSRSSKQSPSSHDGVSHLPEQPFLPPPGLHTIKSSTPQKTSGATAGALTASFRRGESPDHQGSALRASQFSAPLTGAAPPRHDLIWSQELRGSSWTTSWHIQRFASLSPASHTDVKRARTRTGATRDQLSILLPDHLSSPLLSFSQQLSSTLSCSSLTDTQQLCHPSWPKQGQLTEGNS